jgi:hypothetical protein
MASMPGPLPPKKNDKTEELMKGAHGVIKALNKMDEMSGGSSKEIAACKKSLKDYVANVLKGDPSTLEDEKKETVPPASDDNTPPPPEPANAPVDGQPVPA